jgi:hypothetical protein
MAVRRQEIDRHQELTEKAKELREMTGKEWGTERKASKNLPKKPKG